MTDSPIALEAYETLAQAYADRIDTKPHNAYLEQPATFSLLNNIKGKKVLDAGCGPGACTEKLVNKGAEVVGIDISEKMLELAKVRVGSRATIIKADLSKPLPFLESNSFDIVFSSLVVAYIKHLEPLFQQFYRILKTSGILVFSTQHPFADFVYFQSENYFATEKVGATWKGFGEEQVYVPCFRRSLSSLLNPLIQVGFQLNCILEPLPTEDFFHADPEEFQELIKRPVFICIRATKL
ncbi:class I SAM-dependent methyltransferase [Okeania sp. SIO2B3]|uniref:class I SAM-dependent DNA methyltransferase n=1 Tax=Okeania sp. SIO2B3 TaxID=2607784 RepID=UPI0013C0E9DE|nr:class I SAM-dependent methyltransferase [Okeania sp. SIO2B3]NET42961.1 class I SAM-dependent methyltransferase [Okeania sp. SIO2B3]